MPRYCKTCYKEKVDAVVKDEDLSYYEEEDKCEGCGEIKHLVKILDKDPNIMTIAECNCETQNTLKQLENILDS